MTTHLPVPPPSGFLANTAHRGAAAQLIDDADGSITDGLYVADLLDLLSGVALRLAGIDDDTARSVLATLWRTQ